MSNSNQTPLGVINRFQTGSTKGVFVVFTLIFIIVSVFFFLFLNYNQQKKSERLVEKSSLHEKVSILKNSLETEAQTSLKSSLLFSISGKEIDRIQAIYSLKSTKKIYEEYKNVLLSHITDSEISDEIVTLHQLLSDYDMLIAESINNDGRLTEILNKTQQPADTSETILLIEESSIGTEVTDAKILEQTFDKIESQLFAVNNQFNSKINTDIEKIKSASPLLIYTIFTIIIALLVLLLRFVISRIQSSSINTLSEVLDHISRGELPDHDLDDSGELKNIVDAGNQLKNYLDDASQFAIKIGDGDFGYEFKPKSENDTLGNSLIDMRNRLQEVAREDKIRNWINEGQAKFGEILRQHSDDIEVLGSKVIIELVEYLNASQGALFVVKEEGDNTVLELLSSYAYKRKKFIEKKVEIGEGLAGQSYIEGKTIYLTDIKTDHYDIQTGLGESRPSSLLIVPLKQEDRIEGIIEVASLHEINKYQIEFVESIGESIASSLSAGKINQTTKKLLEDTQEKAEQMKAQEEELRQNMEELAATQEQMERRNKEMEEIQQQLTEEKYLLNALLNSTHDRIYFKDKDSKFIRVSNSMITLFGKQDESEILGKSDFDFGFEEHAKVAYDDEQNIIKTAKPMIDAVEKETWDDGRISWVSTTKNPLRDLDGEIIGTFGISRDITKNKEVELEMIKRKEWFENFFKFHPIGFVVLDINGQVSYATKSILSKLHKVDSEGLMFEDIFYDKSFTDFLVNIDFENTKDREIEIELALKDKAKNKINLLAIAGSNSNEDGTQNIFLIQQ